MTGRTQPLGPHPAVEYVMATNGNLRHSHYHCIRCGARRLHEMGERMPVECVPSPQWLREHPDDSR